MAEEIHHVTIKHMSTMRQMVGEVSEAAELVGMVTTKLNMLVSKYSAYDFLVMKQQLMKFFDERNIKVSLFIQDGTQGLDGTVYLDFCGVGPYLSERPGTVLKFDPESGE